MKKLRIALVVPGGVDPSGEVRVIPAFIALIRRLAVHADLHVFALAQERRAGSWSLAGAQVHNAGSPLPLPRCVAAIAREHRRGRFDAVQALFSGSCGLAAALAARSLRIPYAVHVGGGELAALAGIGYGGALRARWRMLEPRQLRGARAVTAASEPMIAALRALGVNARRLPLGADRDVWPVRAPVPRAAHDEVRLVHVASLNRVKDQPTLLRALALLVERGRHVALDVVGEDTLGGEMQALAARLDLASRVRFHGFRTQAQARPIVVAAHVHVMASLHEAGPLAVLEAALSGVPTVGTAVGHIAEWHPDAALAVPTGDANALAGAIAVLLDDEPRRIALAHAAQTRAMAEDADFTAREFLQLHAGIAAR